MSILRISPVKRLVKSQFRWLCLLSLSLTLLLWIGHMVKRNTFHVPLHNRGLSGYARISESRKDQVLDIYCDRCALVSSSGQMLGSGAGEEIDTNECVIRMNNAPTVGYETDVGGRTSVRVVSHTSRNMRQDGKGRVFNALLKIAKKYPEAKLYAVTSEKIQYCDNVFQNETGKNRMKTGAFLSTGFFTMILALDMCDSINVYGMIDNNYCSRANHSVVPYHYYESKRINECRMYKVHENTKRGGHRFITEKAIYAKWATRHKMEFYHPSWKL
uniref:Uncharacterized protein n=1 Tax=Knipowitschia caucasica TaxID=637954 RepID=A0AAV2IUH5_KNICA